MNKTFIVVLIILIASLKSISQTTLTVKITSLRNNEGVILFQLSDEQNKEIKALNREISNNTCTIIISDLPPGRYSIRYFHDENSNKKLDTNFLGIPTEGFGFSNNANGTLGPPKFDETLFEVKKGTTIILNPTYYL